MTRLAILAVVALALSATTALSFQIPPVDEPIAVGIDADATGNEATVLGDIQACREVATGDTFDVDVYVPELPPVVDQAGGIMGFSYNLLFDPAILEVANIVDDMLVQSGGRTSVFELIDADATTESNGDPFPGATGNVRVDYLDLSSTVETGAGVLSRITLRAVGQGESSLVLVDQVNEADAPLVISAAGLRGPGQGAYPISEVRNAAIAVGASCGPAPTPHIPQDPFVEAPTGEQQPTATTSTGPGDTPAPTFTPAGTAPAGDARLAVDAIPTGNAADSVDDVQDCAGADVGDVFTVDVIIEDIEELIAWEATVSYDPDVLKVVDRDVKLFLEASGGQAFDASVQTPDTSGRYGTGAADTADPLSPESGSGVIVRLTMEAVGEGESPVSLASVDLNNDDKPDRGVLLRNSDSEIIGDENGDALFDGPIDDAEIRVGSDCPDAAARVVKAETPSATPTPIEDDDDDDGSSALPWIIGAIVILLLLAGGIGAFMYNRSRRNTLPPPPTTPAV